MRKDASPARIALTPPSVVTLPKSLLLDLLDILSPLPRPPLRPPASYPTSSTHLYPQLSTPHP